MTNFWEMKDQKGPVTFLSVDDQEECEEGSLTDVPWPQKNSDIGETCSQPLSLQPSQQRAVPESSARVAPNLTGMMEESSSCVPSPAASLSPRTLQGFHAERDGSNKIGDIRKIAPKQTGQSS